MTHYIVVYVMYDGVSYVVMDVVVVYDAWCVARYHVWISVCCVVCISIWCTLVWRVFVVLHHIRCITIRVALRVVLCGVLCVVIFSVMHGICDDGMRYVI